MTCSIFIVTYRRDFPYLTYCLRSIEKFAREFKECVILVPEEHVEELKGMVGELSGHCGFPINVKGGKEWPGKGMLWHEAQICRADEWCDADLICHGDADIVFTSAVTPETFMQEGKPLLRYEAFRTIGVRHPGVLNWKIAAEKCLPFEVVNEYMRGHCHCFWRANYAKTREVVASCVGKPFDEYLKSVRNEYPQEFCEFVTLGAVAHRYFEKDYFLSDCGKHDNPDRSPYPVFQAWSHAPPTEVKDLWINGHQVQIAPIEIYRRIGIE